MNVRHATHCALCRRAWPDDSWQQRGWVEEGIVRPSEWYDDLLPFWYLLRYCPTCRHRSDPCPEGTLLGLYLRGELSADDEPHE